MSVRDSKTRGFVELQSLEFPPSGRHGGAQDGQASACCPERDLPDRSAGIAQVCGHADCEARRGSPQRQPFRVRRKYRSSHPDRAFRLEVLGKRCQRCRSAALPPAVDPGQSVCGNAERGNRHGLPASRVVRVRPADRQHGTRRERLPALKRSHLERSIEIRTWRDKGVERDAVRRLVCRAADQRRPVGEGEAAETSRDGDERDDQRRRPGRAGEVDEREAREHRAAPGHALRPPEHRTCGAKRQHPDGHTAKRREQKRQRVIAAGAPSQRRHQRRRRRDRQHVGQPRAVHQYHRAEQQGRRKPRGPQRDRPGRGDHAVHQDRAGRFPLAPCQQRCGPDTHGRADAQRGRAQPPGFHRREQDAVARAGARAAEPIKFGPLIAAKSAAGEDDEQRQRRDRAPARE